MCGCIRGKERRNLGTDDILRKRQATRKKRNHEYKTPRANSYLIVTEGTRTEPLYFWGLQKLIQQTVGGHVNIVAPQIDIHGEGISTMNLLAAAERYVKSARILYQNVWIVFDKDDFQDFDEAIRKGEQMGYHVAWSNPSFEYWLYLHFDFSVASLPRDEWTRKLDEKFRQYHIGDGRYRKNDEAIYEHMNTHGGVNTAIRNARSRMKQYEDARSGMKGHESARSGISGTKGYIVPISPSAYDPGTMVYQLVEELTGYLGA